ncbi:hypothetical protein K1W54_12385 [Micromonospora sp. CPCC 205371]|nr:hypothetical protein [Micromonospora sp. CPCC 205371]
MTYHKQHLEMQLWDLVVQRAVLDADFRNRLLTSPQEAVREMGLPVDDVDVVVRELDDRGRMVIMPPMISTTEPAGLVASPVKAYSVEPPSRPMVGGACCALSDPGDLRALYGGGVRHG